jgi:3-oxoacyl-[acyl-carrier-protein] synthase III
MHRSIIIGSGSYIPPVIQTNAGFSKHLFYTENHAPISATPEEVVEKFKQITGIEERRYAAEKTNCSDIGAIAAELAIRDSGTNAEEIDQLIVAHNFGNVIKHTIQTDAVPSLANRIKHSLGIKNPACVAYDILFGCPGWLQGMIQADAFFKAGIAKKALVVGTETLSRVIDMYDRDSMLFSDGAGAAVVEWQEVNETGPGILGTAVQSHSLEEVGYINMDTSSFPGSDPSIRYIKMKGRKVYEFAMKHVPAAMKECMEKSNVGIQELKKVFIHQANEKMDVGIISRLYQLYGINKVPENIMPMSIHWLGNSSVATIPTLYDLVRKDKVESHHINAGDIILFASVGAGMNINAVCYRY